MAIQVEAGIELGPGVKIGNFAIGTGFFITEIAEEYLITETGDRLIEE
tara:strand:+ start:89 stop:232 length:144 start_codon:yes stop_codon:yes gene_type:complete